jgi:glyoxylase-like metal-dependent hydrolase (beta-lactamase superfamily II)
VAATLSISQGGLRSSTLPDTRQDIVCLLWRKDRGLLFTGDAAANLMGLNYMIGYDDVDAGRASLAKLANLDFEAAVFGHGKPLLSGASDKFVAKFA